MSFELTPETVQLITSLAVIFMLVHMILGGCAYLILLERKLSSWMQDRIGPNRVGPKGLLQPIADGLKFMLKEDYNPEGIDRALFFLAPAVITATAMLGFVVIPFAGTLDLSTLPFGLATTLGLDGMTVQIVGAKVNIGLIYLIAVASLGVYGVVLGGWASNSKFSFLGGLRASAQMISYEIPMGLALLAVILLAGTLDPGRMIQGQLDGTWYILQQPLAALLFYICMLAESNRAPFDMAEAESELIGGYHTEYSSMKFALFFLAEYFHMITGAAFFTLLFLGGWSINPLPWGGDLPVQGGLLMVLLQFAVFAGKVVFLVAFAMVLRWTLPRFRFDQLMKLAWEGMIPTALLVVLVTSVFVFLGWTPWMWAGSIGCIILVYILQPLMPKQEDPNRRIPMIGSRFNPVDDGLEVPRHPVALSDAAIPDPSQGPVSMH
ncbi:MAG: NADH-quinone oxidoreductase subunit NuoH [Phycisphaerae bacterium]|nr:NADH-quinone oxidoreductase subunit NuoH [Phycisphaerae bacterium]